MASCCRCSHCRHVREDELAERQWRPIPQGLRYLGIFGVREDELAERHWRRVNDIGFHGVIVLVVREDELAERHWRRLIRATVMIW